MAMPATATATAMAAPRALVRPAFRPLLHSGQIRPHLLPTPPQCMCRCPRHTSRPFSSTARPHRQQESGDSFGTRLRRALADTKIKWYPIPVGLGIGFLGLVQFYKVTEREKARQREEDDAQDAYLRSKGHGGEGEENGLEGRPKRRQRIRPTGPW
jgi:phosphatidylserine decarboxylase